MNINISRKNFLYILTIFFILCERTLCSENGTIGEIKLSVLSVEEFIKINGPDWVLMDGKTHLAEDNVLRIKTGWTRVPDARGRFIRMKDFGLGLDSNGDLPLGSFENFATGLPKNPFITSKSGNHSHTVNKGGIHSHDMSMDGGHTHLYDGPTGGSRTNLKGWEGTRGASTSTEGEHIHKILESGEHKHTLIPQEDHDHRIELGGDVETRPENIVLNYFVKINDSGSCIEDISSQENVNRYFLCLMDKFKAKKNGPFDLSDEEISQIARDIIYLKNTSFKYLKNDQVDLINRLIDNNGNVLLE